ncbi:Uncharacterised protein [Mycobacteroides abscessus subsp. abscessus]|nr:Uncharacterised protein [Mycobacteroides abscessus subsp. abscessus]
MGRLEGLVTVGVVHFVRIGGLADVQCVAGSRLVIADILVFSDRHDDLLTRPATHQTMRAPSRSRVPRRDAG